MEVKTISHYRILEKLGAGGMGVVYLAEDTKLGRKVALKILGEDYTTNRDRLHRFEQEACSASALNHPNILTIHEVGVDDGRHFIATEYIDGKTLRRKMAGSPLEALAILDIAVQVASALEEAHAAGIIHRDIKPDNIMIRQNGYVKVLDFGLAKLTERAIEREPSDGEASTRVLVQTDAGVVMGTSHYMSPEQARGKPVDARSDIWSLGVVMYEMIAGRTPFEGETSTDVIVAITQKEAPPLARFAPGVPAELDWIVTKALRKDREERYQTIKEFLTDLRRLKQKLEFEAELERSVSPDSTSRSALTNSAAVPTISGRVAPTVEGTSAHHASSAEYLVSEIKRHKTGASILAVLFVLAVGTGVFFYFNRAQALTDKDTILLADFVNTTGEPVFDGTLKQALAVQLGQSPFLNIFPDDRVRETLRFMGRPPDERLTKDVAKEICERQGLKAMLIGSIASLGSTYVVTLEAVNARSGESIAREQVEAGSKEQVLSSLGKAASELREKLGESLSSIKKHDVPIEQATTSSLEALKAYTMGNEERAKGNAEQAATLYQRATELDPNFAMAYARIAVFHGNREQMDEAQKYAQRAYELRDRVSERERLYISEKYYNYVEGDLDKSTEVLQTWTRLYPNDYIPHNNLALQHMYNGKYEDALKEALEAVRLSPTTTSARDNLIGSFMALNRFDEANEALEQLRKIYPEGPTAHFVSYDLAFIRGDHATMEREAKWVVGKSFESGFLSGQGSIAAAKGQLKKSEELKLRAVELYKSQGRKDNAAQALMGLAFKQSAFGKCQQAKETAVAALNLHKGRFTIGSAAGVYAECNDFVRSQALLDESLRLYPRDTPMAKMIAPYLKALLARQRGNHAEAIQILESIRRYDLGIIIGLTNNYLRGQTYLDQRMGKEAAAEFQKIIDHPGIDIYSEQHPLAHLGLARAAAMSGDTAKARTEYQNFLALFRDADADLPVLIEARKEYEQLK
ncbi:MAG TPA: protein kinase [Pyrinomonadaceae bacterium]|nr:protein kinase [Pyrinomonadaceae bacterium]